MQGITGVNEKNRLKMSLIENGEFCAGFCGLTEMMFICGKIVAMAIYLLNLQLYTFTYLLLFRQYGSVILTLPDSKLCTL